MKLLFTSLIALCTSVTSFAQTDALMATLQHGETTTVFYGDDAFKRAYDAAADTLDVITLSGGEHCKTVFPPDIYKSVSIYGAGFEPASSQGGQVTLLGGLRVRNASGVHIEGLCISGLLSVGTDGEDNINGTVIYNTEISKCYAGRIEFSCNSCNTIVRQCRVNMGIAGDTEIGTNNYKHENMLISNCYLRGELSNRTSYYSVGRFSETSTVLVDHCVLVNGYNVTTIGNIGLGRITNSISYVEFNEKLYTAENNIFVNLESKPAMYYSNFFLSEMDLWADDVKNSEYLDEREWNLQTHTDFVGTDGTQIGLHGGTYPWNKIPSIPRITESTIDTSNAANGTITVNLKAEAYTK